jgi:thiamine biosynthesis lipoprotein
MRPALGTLVEIRASGEASKVAKALAEAFEAVDRVQRLMSFHADDSDVSRINAAAPGEAIAIHADTFDVLSAAHLIGELSGGAFDVATAPILVRGGFLPPPRQESREAIQASFRDLELLPPNQVRWHRPGWIDLGGIAKGYAVDRAVAALQAQGVECGVVNAGGDLRCFGDPQPIYVRAAHRPTNLVFLGTLMDAAIATSAGYFCQRDSGRGTVNPLVDPHAAACIRWEHSISVAAADCMTADALTKVVRLAPPALVGVLECLGAQAIIDYRFARRRLGAGGFR